MGKIVRIQKITVFAFGEGETEQVFLKYLRSLYANSKTSVKIDHAGGKDCSYILKKAIRIRSNIDYDHSFILLDTDTKWTQSLVDDAKKNKFELIGSIPCIEGLFLSILEPKKDINVQSSKTLKKHFQNTHLGSARIITDTDCKKLLPKSVLDKAKNIRSLKQIIDIMEGNF